MIIALSRWVCSYCGNNPCTCEDPQKFYRHAWCEVHNTWKKECGCS